MEDREILDVIHALAAEERRLKQLGPAGPLDDPSVPERLHRIAAQRNELWATLREQRAAREAESSEGPDALAS